MRRIRSFVTRSGRVVRGPVEEVEAEPDQQPQQLPIQEAEDIREPEQLLEEERREEAPEPDEQEQPRPVGIGGSGPAERIAAPSSMDIWGMDVWRVAAMVVLACVCLFVITLTLAGICKTGQWAFSRREQETVEVREGNVGMDMEIAGYQNPGSQEIPPKPEAPKATDRANDSTSYNASNSMSYAQRLQSRSRRGTEEREYQKREAISSEPAVDYSSGITEMKDALDNQVAEIKRISADLRKMRKGDRDDW